MLAADTQEIVGAYPLTLEDTPHQVRVNGHSLCREMVFLINAATAAAWQGATPEQLDYFSLAEAVELGAAFFTPLQTVTT